MSLDGMGRARLMGRTDGTHRGTERSSRPTAGEITGPITDDLTVDGAAGVRPAAEDDEVAALRAIVEGTARNTGEAFFQSLVRHLASAVGASYVFVAEFTAVATRVRTLAYWGKGRLCPNVEFDLEGTPCEDVVRGGLCHHPLGVRQKFPRDRALVDLGIESYLGVPLVDGDGSILGHLAVFDERPMPAAPRRLFVFRIFATRAAAELERLRVEQRLVVEITDRVRAEAERSRVQEQNLYLQEEIKSDHNFDEMVGKSPALLTVLDKVRRVAPTDTTVLLSGETGTGKELIARAIHSLSQRRQRSLIKINCAALPAGLVENELFGHEKGAFTGAIARHTGRFELANGGTIFLDEIGELPAEAQAKLLRVLQEREFDRVGGASSIRVDVRIIAATNRDLLKAIREKTFREDLYYRLSVFPVQLPPLRERIEDIPLLADFLLGKFAARLGRRFEGIAPETLRRLAAHPWPGNIRELQNVLERSAILATGPMLEVDPELLGHGHAGAEQESAGKAPSSLEEVERNHILAVLRQTRWVIEGARGAAAILGLHPNTLRSRLKRLGLSRASHERS